MLSRLVPDVRRWVLRRRGVARLGNESADDVVQSVCREALAARSSFEHRGDQEFRSWVRTLAERKLVDRARYWNAEQRQAGRRVELASPGSVSELPDGTREPDDGAADRELEQLLVREIETLTPDQRTVLSLQRSEGLSTREIAVRMGKTPGAVRLLRCRALAVIGERLHRVLGD